ncbi:MAG: hypothetical protein K5873_05370 [Treponema sp.]|nr:hypothetical protein [Treponema sp.]
MFDRLGDLLSQALEKGELPESGDASRDEKAEDVFSDFSFSKESNSPPPPPKKVPPENVKEAMIFIGIEEDSCLSEAKKIYREKLMYYHPDRRKDNPVLQKVAKEKTARLLRDWELIEKWYESQN